MSGAIEAEGLVKTYGDVRALDGLDLEVPQGTVLGVLGPNGAGKTTAVRILTTLLPADAGRASVAGIDVARNPAEVRRRIGLSGQYAAVDERLTGRENLVMFARLHRMSRREARTRADELLARFSLTDAANRVVKNYSGGMRRRLDLASALLGTPEVLFLDEPTTGLDPRSRMDMWGVIDDLVKGGVTLLLTTQYLEEADQLADSIAVIDHGRVIARGTADELKKQVGGETLSLIVEDADDVAVAREVMAPLALAAPAVDPHLRRVTAPVSGGAGALVEVVRALDVRGVRLLDVGLHRPTLDDVFLTLTGRPAEDETSDASAKPTAKGRP